MMASASSAAGGEDRFPLSVTDQTNIDKQIAQVLRMQELSQKETQADVLAGAALVFDGQHNRRRAFRPADPKCASGWFS